jgi:hypothetical protein
MLMSLLPGLRDLRAPLAAGYLWLAGIWLLLIDSIPVSSKATGILKNIYALTHDLGRGTTLAAITFIAYLIGSVLSVSADGRIVSRGSTLTVILKDVSLRPFRPRGGNFTYSEGLKWASLRVSAKVLNDVRTSLDRIRNSFPDLGLIEIGEHGVIGNSDEEKALYEWYGLKPGKLPEKFGWVDRVWDYAALSMVSGLNSEMRPLVTSLRVSSPPLFDQYDRARGEAEFRLSVAFPLALITGVLSWKWTPLWIIILPGIVMLIKSGLRRARDASDVIGQAALAGYITPSHWVGRDTRPSDAMRLALTEAFREPGSVYFSKPDKDSINIVLKWLINHPDGDPAKIFKLD